MQGPKFPRFRILLASTPKGDPILRRILEPIGQVVSAFTHDEAIAAIGGGVDLVVCSLRFDESRMLELLAQVARQLPDVPFVCCHVLDSELPEPSMQAAFTAAGQVGAVEVVDLAGITRREGADHAAARLRSSVRAHLHGAGHASMS